MAEKDSPFKIPLAVPLIAGAASIGMGLWGASEARDRQEEAEEAERIARDEMNRLRDIYADLDTSNPFANLQNRFEGLENTMEDLTVNQQQAQFERDTMMQSQANVMGNLRGAAGGSGIAALAQSLAQQGQIGAQRASASIGAQESRNQMAAAQQAGQLQQMEAQGGVNLDQLRAQGERETQQMEIAKQATLLGMSQQETAAYMQQAQDAQSARWDAISGTFSNVTSMLGNIPWGG